MMSPSKNTPKLSAKPVMQAQRPSRKAKAQEAEAATIVNGAPMRISIRVAAVTHRELKIRATEAGTSIKSYLLDMLRERGITVPDE